MKDIEGKDLKVGDDVIFTYAYGNQLYKTRISRITKGTVYLGTGAWNFRCRRPQNSIYKIENNE